MGNFKGKYETKIQTRGGKKKPITTVASGLCDIPYTFLMSATGLWTLQKNKIK